jgi:hypothetical protein
MRAAKLKMALLAVALVVATAACGTSRADTVPSDHTASATCPSVRAPGWQRWANRVHMTVFCPTWLPIYIDGVIGGDLNTGASPGRFWQLHFVWRSDDFSQLIHVVFEGYAAGTWPHRCGGVPCYGGRDGIETLGDHTVTWYTRNRGPSTGHIAAVFRDAGNTYVVSLHVIDPYTAATARATVARIVKGLEPVQPSTA